ncbi:hypothetical protein GCM10027075_26350 [Streptomyces heilongjiangensis]
MVAHRDGSRTLSVYREDDPDDCALSARLTSGEAEGIVDATMPQHHRTSLLATTELGLVAERGELAATSHWKGRLLRETRMRTETGVSVVAVLRRAEAVPSPGPEFRLAGGDTLIVIGTRGGRGGCRRDTRVGGSPPGQKPRCRVHGLRHRRVRTRTAPRRQGPPSVPLRRAGG